MKIDRLTDKQTVDLLSLLSFLEIRLERSTDLLYVNIPAHFEHPFKEKTTNFVTKIK
jgi:hypothetical protein